MCFSSVKSNENNSDGHLWGYLSDDIEGVTAAVDDVRLAAAVVVVGAAVMTATVVDAGGAALLACVKGIATDGVGGTNTGRVVVVVVVVS